MRWYFVIAIIFYFYSPWRVVCLCIGQGHILSEFLFLFVYVTLVVNIIPVAWAVFVSSK